MATGSSTTHVACLSLLVLLAAACGPVTGGPAPADDAGVAPHRDRDGGQCMISRVMGHASGDYRHNACADRYGPNGFWNANSPAGCGDEAQVGGFVPPRFDAVKFAANHPGQMLDQLQEIKVINDWPSYSAFVKKQQLDSDKRDIIADLSVAHDCGYQYIFASTDQHHVQDVNDAVTQLLMDGLIPNDPNFLVVELTGCPESDPNLPVQKPTCP